MGKKTKSKSARSVTSSLSKSSGSTHRASNRSSPTGTRKTRPKQTQTPTTPSTPPMRTPETLSESAPVDLDDMADALNRDHHNQNNHNSHELLSPAETFDTVPLSASPSRSFGSRVGPGGNRKRATNEENNDDDDDRSGSGSDYLPVSLLSFDSPDATERERNNRGAIRNSSEDTSQTGNNNQKNNNKTKEKKKKRKSDGGNGARSGPVVCCGGGRGALFLCLIKPVLAILLLAAVVSGAASLYGWVFRFPALNRQVEALEEQVLVLRAEVDRLETENDRYALLNDRLNGTVENLEGVRDDLNGTASDLDAVAETLNTTKDKIVEEVRELQLRNLEYSRLNQDLRDQVSALGSDLDAFEASLEELSTEHSVLKNTTESLRDLAVRFSNTTVDQNETLAVLRETLDGFRIENDRLDDTNRALEAGLGYLNETLLENGVRLQTSAVALAELTTVLGETVRQQQRSTSTQLEISYRQITAGWDCDYRDVFRSKGYGRDFAEPILGTTIAEDGSVLLPTDLRTYLGDRVLSKLCLDGSAFSKYLFALTAGEGRVVTSDELVRAVALYAEEAMGYYFPPLETANGTSAGTAAGDGIGLAEWIDAGFRCDLLERPFAGTVPAAAKTPINVRRNRRSLRRGQLDRR